MKWVIARPGLAVLDDDRQDRYWAGTASAVLHLALIMLALASPAGGSRRSGNMSNGNGASTVVSFEPTEFRQKVELVARTDDSPRPAESLPESIANPPIELSQPLPEAPDAVSPSSSGNSSTVAQSPQASELVAGSQARASEGVASATAGSTGNPDSIGLRDAYLKALRAAIFNKWGRPNANLTGCTIALEQGINGLVVSARVSGCSLSSEERDSLESAALMAQPLPYAGYETVFQNELELSLSR